jgi:hypothetical protein
MSEIVENLEDEFTDLPDEGIMKELQKSEEDIKAGRTISLSDFKEKIRNRFNLEI